MDGVEGPSRKRKRSEDFTPRSAKRTNRRKTISCVDGIKRKSDPQIARANKSLTLVPSKKLKKSLPKTPKSSNVVRKPPTPRSRDSISSGRVGAEMREANKSPVKSTKKTPKLAVGESSTKLLNTHAKSKIPKRTSLSKNSNKMQCQKNLGLSAKSVSKIHRKPLIKKSVLDRAVKSVLDREAKPFQLSKRAAPMLTVPFVTKIPSSFRFEPKTKQNPLPPKKASPKKASPKKEAGKSTVKNILDQSSSNISTKNMETKSSPRKISSKESIPETKLSSVRKDSPNNMSMEVKPSSSKKVSSPRNKSMIKTSPKKITFSVNKSRSLRKSISKIRITKKMSMEMKPSSTKNKSSSLNKSMPTKLSSPRKDCLSLSQIRKFETLKQTTKLCDSNARTATNKTIVKTPVIQGKIKVEQTSLNKTPNRKTVSNGKSDEGNKGNELSKERKIMSYSSAVKRKPANKIIPSQASVKVESADKKPVAIPRNIIIQANRKPAFSNRHINSPDPIIISRGSLKSLANKSASKRDMKKVLKPINPKQASKPSSLKTSSSRTRNFTSQSQHNISRNKTSKDTAKTPIISKASASKSGTEPFRRKFSINANKSSTPDELNTPCGSGIQNIAMNNDSLLKSCMKQNRGPISCKKVNFDMSNSILKSSQGEIYKDLSINTDICNEKEIVDISKEPSKCFLAALNLSCDSFLSSTTIINSPLKRTRRSSTKSNFIHASTPIQSFRESDWLVNTPTSSMIMVHSDHSKNTAPGSSKQIQFSAGKNILNLSTSNASFSHNLPPCEVYLTPHITAETLNISVENFVSPLTPSALGLNLKNESRLSSRARKSVSNTVSDSLEVLTPKSKCLKQSLSRSKTLSAAKASYSTKSPKNDLQDFSGVESILSARQESPKIDISDVERLLISKQKSPKNDLNDVRGVKRLLSSPQKSPKNDLRDVRGVKRLLSSPQKSPKNDLQDVRGVKRLLSQKSPKNDLQDVRGVKRLLSSPQKSPENDLRDVRGVKRLLSSPQKSPKNDLRDVRGVKRLLSSPQKSPKNDLQDVRGVKRLYSSQKSPKNDLRNVSGVKQLLKTPSKIISRTTRKINGEELKPIFPTGVEKGAIEGLPPNVHIKVEGKTQHIKCELEIPTEGVVLHKSKSEVNQETDLSAINTQDKLVVQRRTRRNVQKSTNAELESLADSNKELTTRKTRSKVQETSVSSTKAGASKRTRRNLPDETLVIKPLSTRRSRRTPGPRKSSGSSALQKNLRQRKSSGVFVVSAKKVQFNPSEEKSAGKKMGSKSAPSDKATPLKKPRATKATRAVSKSSEEKSAGKKMGSKSAPSDKATPLKKPRATKATRAVSKSSEEKSAGKKMGSKSAPSDKATPLKKPRATKATRAVSKSSKEKSAGKKKGSKSAPSDKATPLKKPRATKATRAVSKRNLDTTEERKELILEQVVKERHGGKKDANPGTSSEGTSSAKEKMSSPLKAKRATTAKTADSKNEVKSIRGKKNANPGKNGEGSSTVEKDSSLKEKDTKSATKASGTGARTTRARKVAETVTSENKGSTAVKAATTSRRKVAANKENVPASKDVTSPSDVPRRVLRKRK